MKATILGPAYPYRGGLASIMETLARTFSKRGDRARVLTFTVQYPSLLFPGKSQYRDGEPPTDVDITRCVSTVNPLNWIKVGQLIRREAPDLLVLKYWTPFMAPCFGTIARIARGNKHTRVVCQIDNVVPHEHHWFDSMLTRYFVNSMDGFVYMSHEVGRELEQFTRGQKCVYSPHPMFENFGSPIPRSEACNRLGLNPGVHYMLFFGLVRDYKGLDILLDAWARLKSTGATEGRRLIVAGEFYTDPRPYTEQIERLGLSEDVILHNWFVPDEQVPLYFSLADALVLPYRTATQSGVTQIAYNFDVPMIATDVGGLGEIVIHERTGLMCEPSVEGVAAALERFWNEELHDSMVAAMPEEKKRFSWDHAIDALLSAADI
ncbi:MAG: glycosyltransferase family 4 protein [Rikenellaceae bacterium]|nr:glycosyltransferase family 4 protein [Rikenellaceae bacterium]